MSDDSLDWLSAMLDDDEPTIPDANGHGSWPHLGLYDDDTGPTTALDETGDLSLEWELEL